MVSSIAFNAATPPQISQKNDTIEVVVFIFIVGVYFPSELRISLDPTFRKHMLPKQQA